jgi:type IV pilus assembly protein PilY1
MNTIRVTPARIVFAAGLMLACLGASWTPAAVAQTANVVQDSFTGTSATLSWAPFNGACLTAGNGTGTVPACNGLAYYGSQVQTGLTNNTDTVGNGALRLTNGCAPVTTTSGGKTTTTNTCYYNQNGAIISTTPFPSNQGIQVTFTTYTYGGDNSGGHGADGIGFYLLNGADAAEVTTAAGNPNNTGGTNTWNLGSFGGSLGYSCSNSNNPYIGMTDGYIGLGMDEYGNFLNNSDNTASGDQATSINGGNGAEYQPGRIGMRGYGNINLVSLQAAVNAAGGGYTATSTDVNNVCKNGGTFTFNNGTYTTTYNYTYTYPQNGNIPTLYSTAQTTTVYSSPSTPTPSGCTAQSTPATVVGTPVITGAPGPAGNNQTYSGSLYSQKVTGPTQTTTPVTGTYTLAYTQGTGGNKKNCTETFKQVATTVTTTTTYGYTVQGATISGTTSSSNDGDPTTPQFGVVSGNYYQVTSTQATTKTANTSTITPLPDYTAIPNAFVNLTSATPIAIETASVRTSGVPIAYKLQVTQSGLLSLSYSYNGGTYNPVLTNQNIASSNGTMPSSFLFGFGGSTGGSDNVHEITCFQATPANVSASSAGLNVQQAGQVKTGTQVYLAYYHPNNWWGELDAQNLVVNTTTGVVSIDTTANWDASCVLTGGACPATAATSGTAQATRTLLTSNGAATTPGINFSNTTGFTSSGDTTAFGTLSNAEQAWLEAGTTTGSAGGARLLAYLSGDRSNEVPTSNATSSQIYRSRTSVLADIIDSSPTWVGPPSAPYTAVWADKLYPLQAVPENATGATTYPAFVTNDATRLNVVYDGANDGFMHAFETGSYNTDGSYNTTGNDGKELFAYMPQAVLNTIHNGTTATLDYASPNYSHNYFVDATPGTGDLFYSSGWHTWLVGGLGAGGNAIYAIDITSPASGFSASNVMGEWGTGAVTGTNGLVCAGDTGSGTSATLCANDLGQSYGTPQIRRLHNGQWGLIFGNGLNSATGHAGIYVMTISTSGVPSTVYYLDTGVAGTKTNPDGIAYVTPTDLDGDHITDYVYAGDAYGNVWRFDLTNSSPAKWGVTDYSSSAIPGTSTTPAALFTTPSTSTTTCSVTTTPCPTADQTTTTTNQPITTAVVVLSVAPNATGTPRIMVEFGTGNVIPQTTTAAIQYTPGQQTLYGIWDWKVGQSGTVGSSYDGLSGSTAPTAGFKIGSLLQQTVTSQTSSTTSGTGQGYRTVSDLTICFVGMTCNSVAGTQYGWYMNLPGFAGVSSVGLSNQTEQVIYSPVEVEGAFIVNTTIPANNAPLTCTVQNALGWTMALNPATGGAFTQSFFSSGGGVFVNVNGSPVSGIAVNATGSPSVVTANGNPYLISQTTSGTGTVNQINPPGGNLGGRLTWIELH